MARRRFRGTPMVLGLPDIGTHLNTLRINNHHAFHDNVLFVLNNHAPHNQIHVHRGPNGGVLFISKKRTEDGGSPGVPVGQNTALWVAAENAVANIALA
ncbi:hypothetical protein [Telluria beijingensis]|uniref:hypothetical protein n=1 Tax=Telluria beijingensis TaxID=3068633 RepID=UPI0027957E28|nr:hypothetical protein [Massilia sp. REN29]